MSYVRPVRLSELVDWLFGEGVDDENTDVEALAQAMINKFDILTYSMEPT